MYEAASKLHKNINVIFLLINYTNQYVCFLIKTKRMKKLKNNLLVPNFEAEDYLGRKINLDNHRGKKILLSFHVFASCPFCNLRINELENNYAQSWKELNFEMVHVFPSPGSKIAEFVGKNNPEYIVIADPNKELYKQFGLKTSISGMFLGFLKIRRLFKAFQVVNLFRSLKNNDAPMHQLPADFLIDEKGIIREAFYAKTVSDNLSISTIENFITNRKLYAA